MEERRGVKMSEQQKISEIRELLVKATKLLDTLVVETDGAGGVKLEDWMKDRVELWCRIYNEGGIVAKEKLWYLWEKVMKKDKRGLGGFFVGKKASLQMTADEKVVLTANAKSAIENWTGETIENVAKTYKK